MVIVRQENLVVLRREKGMFEFRKKATLFADEFEVFNTPSMGLGVRVIIEQASQSAVFFRPLSLHALHVFLEVIPESLFEELRSIGHKSLYETYDRTSRKWVFSILLGSLSLVFRKVVYPDLCVCVFVL